MSSLLKSATNGLRKREGAAHIKIGLCCSSVLGSICIIALINMSRIEALLVRILVAQVQQPTVMDSDVKAAVRFSSNYARLSVE